MVFGVSLIEQSSNCTHAASPYEILLKVEHVIQVFDGTVEIILLAES